MPQFSDIIDPRLGYRYEVWLMKVDWVIKDEQTLRGAAYLRATGVPVHRLKVLWDSGATDEDIMKRYPHLTREHLDWARLALAGKPAKA